MLFRYMTSETAPKFQSTLPRGERRHTPRQEESILSISIHAPAWGATRTLMEMYQEKCISIHAPAWGATKPAAIYPVATLFQSTLPRGERQTVPKEGIAANEFQSTLPRGERQGILTKIPLIQHNFNPRSRVGSDCKDH